jgi:hypothetical protein
MAGPERGGRVRMMTKETPTSVIPGRAQREPGISRHNVEIPDRSFGPSGMTTR